MMFEQDRPLSGLGNCANSGYFVGSFRYLANVNLLLLLLRPQGDLTNNMDMGRCRRPTDRPTLAETCERKDLILG